MSNIISGYSVIGYTKPYAERGRAEITDYVVKDTIFNFWPLGFVLTGINIMLSLKTELYCAKYFGFISKKIKQSDSPII